LHRRDRVDHRLSQLIFDDIATIASIASTQANTRPVSWQWGGGKPGGVASEVATEGELTMETKNGNTVKKNADPENPAVRVERSGHDVVKRASELEIEEKGENHTDDKKDDGEKKDSEDDKKDSEEKSDEKSDEKESEKKDDEDKENGDDKKDAEKETNGDAQAGDKRKADDESEEKTDDKSDDKADEKKADKAEEPKENGDAPPPKKKGRPAKNPNAPKAEKPKKEPKKAATESGQPRRSGRNR
jgi:hypothetical protein